MDREDLDRKLKENGEAMKETSHGSKSGRMKIAALALSMLIIGGAGGCYFGDFALPKKEGPPLPTSSPREPIRRWKTFQLSATQRWCRQSRKWVRLL